ncbi:MAG: transporter substrate-binding domain-containing protein [Kangiellaceae bacterium]|nr:transporter substrate-binding domain-containing protein [Kangiellaceae bacterium]MCW9016050.1 transporter substrate-binding domain-containing protein [Kangiellaceae bacterium]
MLKHLAVKVLSIVLVSLFIPTDGLAQAKVKNTAETCQLVIGWHHWPPFQHLNESNQPVGFQIELAKKLATMANCKVSFLQQTFEKNLEGMRKGRIDVVFDITPTEQRTKYGHFSIPYRREMYVLYVWPEYFERCRSSGLDELIEGGFRLMLNGGVIYGDDISELQKNDSLRRLIQYEPSNARLLNLFITKEIDGIVEDPMVMAFNKRTEEKLRKARACHISVNTELVSIMFSKQTVSPIIVEKFNQAIEKAKKAPGYLQIWGI